MIIPLLVVLLIVSIWALNFSSHRFVKYASQLAQRVNVPSYIIGITVVAIGTSLPELVSGITAVFQDKTEFVVSNAVGSNIANMIFVIPLAILLTRTALKRGTARGIDIFWLALITTVFFLIMLTQSVTPLSAGLLMGLFFVYVMYLTTSGKTPSNTIQTQKFNVAKNLLGLAVFAGGIYFAAQAVIFSVIELVEVLHFKDTTFIALSVVALGTSLPEFFVSKSALMQKQQDLAIGNIIGSNIFNLLIVVSIPAFFTTLSIPPTLVMISGTMLLLATALFAVALYKGGIPRSMAVIMILIYVAYLFESLIL